MISIFKKHKATPTFMLKCNDKTGKIDGLFLIKTIFAMTFFIIMMWFFLDSFGHANNENY